MAAPTRRRLTAEERRAAILDAALSAFSKKGYHATSIDDIAGEAAVVGRMVEQVTVEVTGLIALDPGARALDEADHDPALRLLAEMLVGGVQSMANWWTDHPEMSRAQMVDIAMDFAWLGLERLSRGERWSRPG